MYQCRLTAVRDDCQQAQDQPNKRNETKFTRTPIVGYKTTLGHKSGLSINGGQAETSKIVARSRPVSAISVEAVTF